MSLETGERKEAPSLEGALHIYLPGILGTTQGTKEAYRHIRQVILDQDSQATFIGKNSLISIDTLKHPDKDRYQVLAQEVIAALDQNRGVYLFGHSLGVAELTRVIAQIKKMRTDFTIQSQNLENLHLILMSPVGFGKNLKQMAEMLLRLRSMILFLPEKGNPIFGLETLAYLPLIEVSGSSNEPTFLSPADMAVLVTRNFYEHSQLGDFGQSREVGGIPSLLLPPASGTTLERFFSLSASEQQRLKIIDTTISNLNRVNKAQEVRAAFARRGKLLAKYVKATLDGLPRTDTDMDQEAETQPLEKATLGLYAQAILSSIRLLSGVVRGTPYKELTALQQAGVDISFMVPEFDDLIRLSEVIDFLGDEEIDQQTVLLRTTTHNSAFVSPKILAEAVGHFLKT